MLIVFNPAAGARRRRRLERALAALGAGVDVAETSGPGHAARLARDAVRRGVGMVVAAGGDGTIAEVAAGLAGGATALGILPLGTANVLAQELGLPLRPEAAAAVLVRGRRTWLRPGLARFGDGSERLFVQMLGAGFDAAVVAGLDLGLKQRIGRAAYVWQSLRELPRYRFAPITATLDGVSHRVSSAIVTKGRLYAGRFLLAPDALPGEPGFRVALFRGGAVSAALYGAALPLNLLPRMPGVVVVHASHVSLLAEAVPVQADGDPAGMLPVSVEDSAFPLSVVVG